MDYLHYGLFMEIKPRLSSNPTFKSLRNEPASYWYRQILNFILQSIALNAIILYWRYFPIDKHQPHQEVLDFQNISRLMTMLLSGLQTYLLLAIPYSPLFHTLAYIFDAKYTPMMEKPWLATSPKDFWSKRWNMFVKKNIHALAFRPVVYIMAWIRSYSQSLVHSNSPIMDSKVVDFKVIKKKQRKSKGKKSSSSSSSSSKRRKSKTNSQQYRHSIDLNQIHNEIVEKVNQGKSNTIGLPSPPPTPILKNEEWNGKSKSFMDKKDVHHYDQCQGQGISEKNRIPKLDAAIGGLASFAFSALFHEYLLWMVLDNHIIGTVKSCYYGFFLFFFSFLSFSFLLS